MGVLLSKRRPWKDVPVESVTPQETLNRLTAREPHRITIGKERNATTVKMYLPRLLSAETAAEIPKPSLSSQGGCLNVVLWGGLPNRRGARWFVVHIHQLTQGIAPAR